MLIGELSSVEYRADSVALEKSIISVQENHIPISRFI